MVGYSYRGRQIPDRVQGVEARHEVEPHVRDSQPQDPPVYGEDQDVTADPHVSRALSLAATLLDAAPSGLSKAEIRERVDLYHHDAGTEEAFDQSFSRDKRYLRLNGIEILEQDGAEASDASSGSAASGPGGSHDHRYLIDPRTHGLEPIELSAEEIFALQHAQGLWTGTRAQVAIRQAAGALLDPHPRDPAGEGGVDQSSLADVHVGLADDRVLDHVSVLAGARGDSAVSFQYSPRGRHRRQQRRVVPIGVGARGGWYLVAHDLDRGAVRIFRLDRISGPITALESGAEGETIQRGLLSGSIDGVEETRRHLDTLGPERGRERVRLLVSEQVAPSMAPYAVSDSPAAADSEGAPMPMTIETSLRDSFIGRVAVALSGVEIVEGDRLRKLVTDHLRAVVRAHDELPTLTSPLRTPRAPHAGNAAQAKIARVMNMASFLHTTGGARPSELLARYSITVRQLHRDLLSLQQSAAFDSTQFGHYIDVAPELPLTSRAFEEELLTADPLISVQLPGDRLADTLGRPLRLSTPEALSLLIALEGLIASTDPAEKGLRGAGESLRGKIRAVVPDSLADTAAELSVAWATADDFDRAPQLREALRDGCAVELLYEDGRGRRSRRTVDPVGLIHDGSRTYLRAWCRSAEGERNFLLTRMLELTRLTETPVSQESRVLGRSPGRRPEVPRGVDDTLVTLHFAPSSAALADDYSPLREAVTEHGGRVAEVALRSSAVATELVLRYGGDVTVMDPPQLRKEILHRAQAGLASLSETTPSRVEYPGAQTKGRTS